MRGGSRKNAGRKGEWKAGKTKSVKLPEKLLPKIITLAKALDEGYEVKVLGLDNLETESKVSSSSLVTESKNFDANLVTESSLDPIKSQLKEIEKKIDSLVNPVKTEEVEPIEASPDNPSNQVQNLEKESNELEKIKSQLREIEEKIENQEAGFKSNSFGKGIKQLKELFSQLEKEGG